MTWDPTKLFRQLPTSQLYIDVNKSALAWAIKCQVKADGTLHGYRSMSPDRWIGHLGELYFKLLLDQKNIEYIWDAIPGVNIPWDFQIGACGTKVDIKTQRAINKNDRRDLVVNAEQFEACEAEYFFFTRFMGDANNGRIWLMGGIHKDVFLAFSEFRESGTSRVNGTAVQKDEFGVPVSKAVTPDLWLEQLNLIQNQDHLYGY